MRPMYALLLAFGLAGGIALQRTGSQPQQAILAEDRPAPQLPLPLATSIVDVCSSKPFSTSGPRAKNTEWAIPFGHEFWRNGRAKSSQTPSAISGRAIDDAMERVTHVFTHMEGKAEVAFSGGVARIVAGGLRFVNQSALELLEATPIFRTLSPRRSGAFDKATQAGVSEWHIVGNTAQRRVSSSPQIIEHLEATRRGVQVTWVLPEAPPDGDFIIEAQLENTRFLSRDDAGHLLASVDGKTRLRVGNVEVVDSSGASWGMRMEYEQGVLRVRVPASVMQGAAYPLAIDPLISPEFELDAPLDGVSPSTRFSPSVAASESGYLVVWTQSGGETVPPGVFAARLDAHGQLLDPYALHISPASEQAKCAVAGQGGLYFVTWASLRSNSTTEWDIFGSRILSDGTVLDRPARVICGINGHQSSPALAANGTNFLVAWRDARASGIFANLVHTNGNVLLSQGFPICTAVNEQFVPTVASLNGDYLVAWEDYRSALSSRLHPDIYGARVSGAGRVIDTNGFAICTLTNAQYAPTVAASGSNYLVVWEDYSATGNDIEGARVSPGGQVLDNPPIQIAPLRNAQFTPSATASGQGWFVAWQDYSPSTTNRYHAVISGRFVNADGTVSAGNPQILSTVAGQLARPSAASLGAGFSVVWQDDRRSPLTMLNDVFAYTEGLTVPPALPNVRVSGTANVELSPALAFNGTNYLVVWADSRNSVTQGKDILGLRLRSDGGLLDTQAIAICTNANQQTDPAVAAGHGGFLVTWADWRYTTPSNVPQSDIYGTLVSDDGTLTLPDVFPICTATNDQSLPALAVLGTNYLVVWQDARSNSIPSGTDIFGTRVTPGGQVLDALGIGICTNRAHQTAPAVSAFQDQALVVWTDFRNNALAGDIFGARVLEPGVLADLAALPLCTAGGAQSAPALAAGPSGCLVAWTDARNGTLFGTDIYATFVNWDGVIVPTNGLAMRSARGAQSAPTVAFNGLDFLIAWQEPQTGITNFFDLYATGANADGSLWGGLPIPLVATSENQELPVWAAGDGSHVLLLNQTFRYSAPRITGQLAQLSAVPRLTAPRLVEGRATLAVRGAPGASYRVDTSADLTTWTELDTFVMTNSPVDILDASAASNNVRFYRAILLQ